MTFLIAEIGINHNGDMSVAKKLIDEAQIAGFDAVKFQKRNIDKVYSKEILDSLRDSPWGTTQREQKKGLEFDKSQYEEIDNYCKAKNMIWFASAWETDSLEFLDQFDLKYNKIASAMIVDSNFLYQVALRKKHTFISTGMSTIENIENAVDIFRKNNCSFELMHCVSTYPCKPEDVNLKAINSLKEKFNCKVGYSGHENGVVISLAAYTLNISSLERHITLDRTMYGSDQSASLEIKGMRELINGIKKIDNSLGDGKLGLILDDEKKIAQKLRSHIL
ncbi:N-acetylneuraminate synthase family protein [Candidatus Pelagibacter ubique]|uniref:N-acetylneuraminate synthase family protein n=1 Tax=Pelagibacter ubique TaxID=198252 RepID=UPI0003C7EA68